MSTVNTLDSIASWAEKNICSKIKLKVPPEERKPDAAGYDYKLVNPAAFAMYAPPNDRLPSNVLAPAPSLCVGILEGTDQAMSSLGVLRVQFTLTTWNTGEHGKDLYYPTSVKGVYKNFDTQEAKEQFKRTADGWKDVWNFVDIARREVETTEYISGLRVLKEHGVRYGPFIDGGVLADTRPFWQAWLTFELSYGLTRSNPELNKFL